MPVLLSQNLTPLMRTICRNQSSLESLPADGFFRAGVNCFLDLILGASRLADNLCLFRVVVQFEAIFGYGATSATSRAFFFIHDYCLSHLVSFPNFFSILEHNPGVTYDVYMFRFFQSTLNVRALA